MSWTFPVLIGLLGLPATIAQEASEKAGPPRASISLDNLTIEVVPNERLGGITLAVKENEVSESWEVPKLRGTITKLSTCAWNSNRGIAIAIETKTGDGWSYHWMSFDVYKIEGKVEVKLAGLSTEPFLSNLPDEHTVGITNPSSDTIQVLLTRKNPAPPAAIGYLYVHKCPVGPFASKDSGYVKLHELRALEIEKRK